MNSTKKLAIVLLMLLCVTCVFTACDLIPMPAMYTITSEKDSYTVKVGDTIDFTTYFTITGSDNSNITVTNDMVDSTSADLSKTGTFTVTCSYEKASKTITFIVENNSTGGASNKLPI